MSEKKENLYYYLNTSWQNLVIYHATPERMCAYPVHYGLTDNFAFSKLNKNA